MICRYAVYRRRDGSFELPHIAANRKMHISGKDAYQSEQLYHGAELRILNIQLGGELEQKVESIIGFDLPPSAARAKNGRRQWGLNMHELWWHVSGETGVLLECTMARRSA